MSHHLPPKPKSFHWLDPQYHWAFFLGSLLAIGFFAYIDYLDGPEIHISAMYMVPVYFCTWFVGFRAGVALSLLSGLTLLIDPIFYPHAYSSLKPILFNTASQFAVNTIFTTSLALLKKKFSEQHDMLRHDGLTGLLNAEAFYELAEKERLRSIRYGHPMTLCFLDLDNFKEVNDTRGHLAGSELLKMTADKLIQSVRKTDQVARLGGDEFIILFPESGLDEVEFLLEKIQKELREAFQERLCPTTPSMGVATFYDQPTSVNLIVSLVDELMYRAKKNGKNQIVAKVFEA